MKAIIYKSYGSHENLQLEEIEKPIPKENEVLIKVHAVSLNASDNEMLTATPSYVRMWGLFKPKFNILGSDVAGTIEAIGKNITQFKIGDEVFADVMERWGGLAEYVCIPESLLLEKPADMTFEEVAALPQAAVVALQGVRDKKEIKSGQKILINGAGGGAGTFAIQIAKLLGAEVTGVDHAEKFELMRSLGADYVIDYRKEDYTKNGKQYDKIVDFVAAHSIFKNKNALTSDGNYVVVGGAIPKLLSAGIWGALISLTGKKKMGILVHNQNKKDISYIIDLIQNKKIKPIIEKCYSLEETPKAFEHLGNGKALGKIVVSIP